MPEVSQWKIEIKAVYDDKSYENCSSFNVYFNNKLGLIVPSSLAADCTEVMKAIGDHINDNGFPDDEIITLDNEDSYEYLNDDEDEN